MRSQQTARTSHCVDISSMSRNGDSRAAREAWGCTFCIMLFVLQSVDLTRAMTHTHIPFLKSRFPSQMLFCMEFYAYGSGILQASMLS